MTKIKKSPKIIKPKLRVLAEAAPQKPVYNLEGATGFYFLCVTLQGGAISNVLCTSIPDTIANYRNAKMNVIINSVTELSKEDYVKLLEMAS